MTRLYGGIEGGGTKFICVVAEDGNNIVQEIRIPTTTPDETLTAVINFFKGKMLESLGIGCFGPLDLDASSPTYGAIARTPKPGWSGVNVRAVLQRAMNIPIAIELDVNAAAYGEHILVQENNRFDPLVYFTIGTGIGAGIIIHGEIVHGLTHPEAGHILIPHNWEKDPFPGVCPFHKDCFEGLASGPALSARWNQPADILADEHPAWELEAEYISAALVNVLLTVSPQRIVLGGGVMEREFLFPLIRERVARLLNDYVMSPKLQEEIDNFIVPPALGNKSGILGALEMAKIAREGKP